MDKQQYQAVLDFLKVQAEAEVQHGIPDGVFKHVYQSMVDDNAQTAEDRAKSVDSTINAAFQTASLIGMWEKAGMANGQMRADMMAFGGIGFALQMAKQVAAASIQIEIAG